MVRSVRHMLSSLPGATISTVSYFKLPCYLVELFPNSWQYIVAIGLGCTLFDM
jgi:hypothetical protein